MRLLRALRRLFTRRQVAAVEPERRIEQLIQSGIAGNKFPPR